MAKEKNNKNKKIKFYIILSVILSFLIMLRASIIRKSLVCGLLNQVKNCPIYVWLIQVLIFALFIFLILIFFMPALKLLWKLIKKIFKSTEKIASEKTKKEKDIKYDTTAKKADIDKNKKKIEDSKDKDSEDNKDEVIKI